MTPTDDFIEDVKSSVRQDQLIQLWKEYGNLIIAVILTIIIFTGGYLFWNQYQARKSHQQTRLFETALEGKADPESLDKLIKDGSQGYKILALFHQAKLALSNFASAEQKLKELQNTKNLDPFYRDAARLQAVMVKFEATKSGDLVKEIEEIVSHNGPLKSAALELLGFAYIKNGQVSRAIETFSTVMNEATAPRHMKIRAIAMVENLTHKN